MQLARREIFEAAVKEGYGHLKKIFRGQLHAVTETAFGDAVNNADIRCCASLPDFHFSTAHNVSFYNSIVH